MPPPVAAERETQAGVVAGVPKPGPATEIAAGALCIVVVSLLAVLPNLVGWALTARPYTLYDYDDYAVYAPIGADAYFNHPTRIADAFSFDDRPTYFPWLVFTPGVMLAKAFGAGPLGVQLFWRLLGGLCLSGGAYALARHHLRRPWLASGLVMLLLCDSGFNWRLPLVQQTLFACQSLSGAWAFLPSSLRLPPPYEFHVHMRVMNPLVSLGFVWIHLFFLARARERGTWPSFVLSGLSFGLLFYVYFYYWTAAALTLAFGLALDPKGRRAYAHTLWLGAAVGLPQVVSSALFKRTASADWGPRVDLFLPIRRTSELNIPELTLLAAAALLPWICLRRRPLLPAWLMLASAFLLSNNQLATGLQIENFHWTWYLLTPCFTYLAGLVAADLVAARAPRVRGLAAVAWALLALHVASGFWLRGLTGLEFARGNRETVREYSAQRFGPGRPSFRPRSVIAGDRRFIQFAQVLENQRALFSPGLCFSPHTDNRTWDERIALNAFLGGQSRAEFEQWQDAAERRLVFDEYTFVGHKGPWGRDPALGRERVESRLAFYDRCARSTEEAVRRYNVRYVALAAGTPPPAYLSRGWKPLQAGSSWSIWERDLPDSAAQKADGAG
ncbi:MAG: hypothetical protein U0835_25460 [Isosphaeraceae bacterium]